MTSVYDFEDEEPTEKTREFAYEGKEFEIICALSPYGFWTVKPKTGAVPKKLDGLFTTYNDAVKAVESYMNKVKLTNGKRTAQRTDGE